MALLILVDGEVKAKAENVGDAWRKAWEIWDKQATPATDYTGERQGPEIIVRVGNA